MDDLSRPARVELDLVRAGTDGSVQERCGGPNHADAGMPGAGGRIQGVPDATWTGSPSSDPGCRLVEIRIPSPTNERVVSVRGHICSPAGGRACNVRYMKKMRMQGLVAAGLAVTVVALGIAAPAPAVASDVVVPPVMNVNYYEHIESIGTRTRSIDIYSREGQYAVVIVGTTGQGLRLEALNLGNLCVQVNSHVQDLGWQGYTAGWSGTSGQGRRIEAVRIVQPTNQSATSCPAAKVEAYQAHVAGLGWLPKVGPGATAGTTGQGRQLEAIAIYFNGVIPHLE